MVSKPSSNSDDRNVKYEYKGLKFSLASDCEFGEVISRGAVNGIGDELQVVLLIHVHSSFCVFPIFRIITAT